MRWCTGGTYWTCRRLVRYRGARGLRRGSQTAPSVGPLWTRRGCPHTNVCRCIPCALSHASAPAALACRANSIVLKALISKPRGAHAGARSCLSLQQAHWCAGAGASSMGAAHRGYSISGCHSTLMIACHVRLAPLTSCPPPPFPPPAHRCPAGHPKPRQNMTPSMSLVRTTARRWMSPTAGPMRRWCPTSSRLCTWMRSLDTRCAPTPARRSCRAGQCLCM